MTPIEEIKEWFAGKRDYHQGVALMQRFSKLRVLANTLAKPGKEKFEQNHKKLAYELGKLKGSNNLVADKIKPDADRPKTGAVVVPPAPGIDDHMPLVNDRPATEYPPIIRKIKYEYAELYRHRSIQHKKMAALPAENNETNNKARALCLADVKAASARMDLLYEYIRAFEEKGTLPDGNLLWPKQKEEELPNSADRLKQIKKNLQSANSKDRNLLEYQSGRKGDKETPMPDGPKRKKIEARIKDREKHIAEIDNKLFDLEISK